MSGTDFVVTFIGTGATIPPIGRKQVSFALRHTSGLTLFDCGEGSQYSLRKYKIATRKEFVICISHFHADHFLGLPGLLSSFQLQGRTEKILILGPIGLRDLVINLLNSNYISILYPIEILELEHGEVFRGNGYTIQVFKAIHEANAISFIWKEKDRPGKINIDKLKELGIKPGPIIGKLQSGKSVEFDGKIIHPKDIIGDKITGRSISYSGDTSPNEEFIAKIPDNSDLLVHEGTYPSNMSELAEERKHSTMTDAAKMAALANVKKLLITHISPRITDFQNEVDEIKKIFINSEIAYDGMRYVIPFLKS